MICGVWVLKILGCTCLISVFLFSDVIVVRFSSVLISSQWSNLIYICAVLLHHRNNYTIIVLLIIIFSLLFDGFNDKITLWCSCDLDKTHKMCTNDGFVTKNRCLATNIILVAMVMDTHTCVIHNSIVWCNKCLLQ